MRTRVTTLWIACLMVAGSTNSVWAQDQERTDVIWARFTDEEIVLDGLLDEAAWEDAEQIQLTWGENAGIPGSGWLIENIASAITEPDDPPVGTVYVLAKGDSLYFAFEVQDKSIGGGGEGIGFWNWDSIFMPFSNKAGFGPTEDGRHHFPPTSETFITWWNNADTTEGGVPIVGIGPRFHSRNALYGVGEGVSVDSQRTEEQVTNWDAAWTIDGTTNDDTHGEDAGYVIETRINMAAAGYDLDKAEGDTVQMSIAINDTDWRWPGDADRAATTRVFFQNNFGGWSAGSAKIHTHPSVTTTSGELPAVDPDVVIPNAANFDAPTIDGSLDDAVWQSTDIGITIQAKNEALMRSWPGVTPYASGYFQPGPVVVPPVLEPSPAHIKWFFKDDWIYFGVDVDDQAVDTTRDEAGDGLTITINHRDTLTTAQFLLPQEYTVTIGPDGVARTDRRFADIPEDAYMVAGSLKGASTGADPSDVDEGYQIELGFDLVQAFGYPVGRGDGAFFFSIHTFDLDRFEDPDQDYNIRTWWSRERTGGVPVWGYMDPNEIIGTATDEFAELPERIELLGNYPNPFNPSTTIRYAIPAGGDVTIHVFDLLGRQVSTLSAGLQAAGRQELTINAGSLASGAYFYRIEVATRSGDAPVSETGRMLLVK